MEISSRASISDLQSFERGVSIICGQGGVSGSIDYKAEKAFQKLLVLNSLRGVDSTGAASVKRNLDRGEIDYVIAKEVGHCYNLLNVRHKDIHDFSDVLASTHRVLIGHCRASTRGASTRVNAHPFGFQNVVGTHNGTIGNSSHRQLKGYLDYDTDSEAIFDTVDREGVAGLMPKLKGYKDPKGNSTCEDAYALVWYDLRDDTINFLRNKERPLWFAFSEDHQQLYWSSEALHLWAAMSEVPKNLEKDYFWELPVDRHYSWKIPQVNKAFDKPRVTIREGRRGDIPFQQGGFQVKPKKDLKSKSNQIPQNPSQNSNHNHNHQDLSTASPLMNSSENGADGQGREDDSQFDGVPIPPGNKTVLWMKFNQSKKQWKYSAYEYGTYYYEVQRAWDVLDEKDKFQAVIAKKIPLGVNSGYFYDDQKNEFRRVGSSESNPVQSSAASQVKQSKLDRIIGDKSKGTFPLFKNDQLHLRWDPQEKHFLLYSFMGFHSDPVWDCKNLKTVPETIPFSKLDIDARHNFVHSGQKEKKVISYRGWKGALLVQQSFEKIMEEGCLNCHRTPEWGNEVRFLDNDNFICEFCMKNPDVVKVAESAVKEEVVAVN